MPDIQPKESKHVKQPAQPKTETKDLPKLALIAVRELNKNMERSMNDIVEEAGATLGIKPNEGWQFDPQGMKFVRTLKADAPGA